MLTEHHARRLALVLYRKEQARVTAVRQVQPGAYVICLEDRRDGRDHVIGSPHDAFAWLISLRRGECYQPRLALCVRCGDLHQDRDVDGELFVACIACQAEIAAALAEDRL